MKGQKKISLSQILVQIQLGKKKGLSFNYLLTFLWSSQLKLNSGFFQAVVNLNQLLPHEEGVTA